MKETTMPDLQNRFETAVAESKTLPARPDNRTMLKLYSLYKQATLGDVTGEKPGPFDMVGRAKYDAWAGLQGVASDTAMQDYVALVESLKL